MPDQFDHDQFDHHQSGSNSFDDRIRHGLADLSTGATNASRSAAAGEIRRRATRRRGIATAGVITAVLVVTGGAIVLADGFDQASIGPAGEPTTSVTSTSPAPSVTTSPTEPPTTPATTATAPSTPPTTSQVTEPPDPPPSATVGPWPAGDPATEIPSSLLLPHEGETFDDPSFTGWDTTQGLDTPWPWEVCGVDTYPGDGGRTDFRMVEMSGYGESQHNALGVWGDAPEAVLVMEELRNAVRTCPDEVVDEWTYSWQIADLDLGGESFLAIRNTTTGGEPTTGGDVVLVMRTGTAIYASYVYADGYPTFDGGVAVDLRLQVAEFAPNMCVFTMAGC